MSTNITAVSFFQSYFQSLPEPSELPMTLLWFAIGFAIGIGILVFVRRMIVQWKAKDRLIAKLRAENDAQRQHIAHVKVPVFGFVYWRELAGKEQKIEELRKLYEPEAGDGEPSKQPLFVQDESWDMLKQLPPLSAFDLEDHYDFVGQMIKDCRTCSATKIGEVTITGVSEPAGDWPEIARVTYTYTGDLSEQQILGVIRELDDETAGSNGRFDSQKRCGGYGLIDARSSLSVGQVLDVFEDGV